MKLPNPIPATLVTMVFALVLVAPPVFAEDGIRISHLYYLSNFTGTIPFNHAGLFVDRPRDEVYVVDGESVRIFNPAGMEVYRIGIAPAHISVHGLAVDDEGDILAITTGSDTPPMLARWSFRGEPKPGLRITGLPADYAGFAPDTLAYQGGHFYLASSMELRVVTADGSGAFLRSYDLAAQLEIPEKDRPGTEMAGFTVDGTGNMLLTIPVLFRAFVISAEGKVASFGKAGSAPGSFGVVSGIVSDGRGHYLVADKLRNVVMAFDSSFKFLTEFGYPGRNPENLVRPNELAMGESGKLYITQVMRRGVSVYSVTSN